MNKMTNTSFEIHMLIMYDGYHLPTEMEGKKPTKFLKGYLKFLTKLLQYSKYRMSSIKSIIHFSTVAKKGHLHNMAEIEEEAVSFPVICQLVARELT